MAITLTATLAKKIPLPGIDYGSLHASITITAEITDLSQVYGESQRLYWLAETAIDTQLALPVANGRLPPGAPTLPVSPSLPPRPTPTPAGNGLHAPASGQQQASRPYRATTRRSPAPVTQSQLAYVGRLMDESRTPLAPILETYQVGALADLSCKQAAELIDQLKAGSLQCRSEA